MEGHRLNVEAKLSRDARRGGRNFGFGQLSGHSHRRYGSSRRGDRGGRVHTENWCDDEEYGARVVDWATGYSVYDDYGWGGEYSPEGWFSGE